MPLPMPNLDTRRWADLVEEGRALIPRYAPQWSDHNIHDPGIMLIELFAWQIEADIYRVNRVPLRHRKKFLQLAGFAPWPPRPARAVLRFALAPGAASQTLPAGLVLAASRDGARTPFRLLHDLSVVDSGIAALQSCDGREYADRTRDWRGGSGFGIWGDAPCIPVPAEPDRQPALYIGLSKPLPPGQPVTFWCRFAGPGADSAARQRLLEDRRAARNDCRPFLPSRPCAPIGAADPACPAGPAVAAGVAESEPVTPPHHSIRTAWEYWDGAAWRTLGGAAGQVADDTRGCTLDGPVTIRIAAPMAARRIGAIDDPFFYLRNRLAAGPPDYLPTALNIEINAVQAEQSLAARSSFAIRPGVRPPAGQEPRAGKTAHLDVEFDADGAITSLAAAPDANRPLAHVCAYAPAGTSRPGALSATLVLAGRGTGLPALALMLPGAPVVPASLRVWMVVQGKPEEWRRCPDFDASGRADAHYILDAMTGVIAFGDGERGRVAPRGAAIVASYDTTAAAGGTPAARATWGLAEADDALNRSILKADPKAVAAAFSLIDSPMPSMAGADQEETDHAAGRAVEAAWAHERLLDLGAAAQSQQTLDGLDRNDVLARAAPARAVTLIDYERLALDVPGAPVARARAWAGLDPRFPGLKAPGTVVVIVVPWLPAERPAASPALIEAVRAFLERRRLVGTRLAVVGPGYLKVTVRATLAVRAGARIERVREAAGAALDAFLDPLHGGPDGRGWPFGRDVYRSEILQVLDQVEGVDHVESLELAADANQPQCGNLCVGPLVLVTPGRHALAVANNAITSGGGHGCSRD